MQVIGITGNAGSGKSELRKYLESLGYPCLDLDQVAHQIYENHPEVLGELVAEFGEEILEEGKLSRPQLAQKAFASQAATQRLNQIVHPLIHQDMDHWLQEQSESPVVFVEATLILEAGRGAQYSQVWVVTVDSEVQMQRLLARGWDESQIQARLSKQWSQERKAQAAEQVISNSQSLEELHQSVDQLLVELDWK